MLYSYWQISYADGRLQAAVGSELAMSRVSSMLGASNDDFRFIPLRIDRAYVTNLDLNPNKGQEGNSKYVFGHLARR